MENGFFKLVWRFNAIAIAFAAIVVIGIGLFIMTNLWQDMTRNRHATQVVNVDDQDTSLNEVFSYGRPLFDRDTQTMIVPLHLAQNYDLSGGYLSSGPSKGTSQNPINHLIVSRKDGAHRWLFADNKQLIIKQHHVSRPVGAEAADQITKARLYEIITADSNGDKRLSDRDLKTLIITQPDRSAPTRLIADYDDLLSVHHPDEGSFEVLTEKAGVFTLYRFAIASHQQIGELELPALPTSR
ncbi:MAG: hypothetical protein L3J30_00050 [Marinosulfonomonas sp.]|nr:hypothetical protein [Marinosulfonomonas sp.]